MTSPLEGAIAAAVNKGFQGVFYDAILTRTTPGEVDPEEPWVPVAGTPVAYTCKAIVEQYSAYHLANSLVEANDRKVLVLANSLSVVPDPATDTITIRGATYSLVGEVKTDPATAIWEIQGRK